MNLDGTWKTVLYNFCKYSQKNKKDTFSVTNDSNLKTIHPVATVNVKSRHILKVQNKFCLIKILKDNKMKYKKLIILSIVLWFTTKKEVFNNRT